MKRFFTKFAAALAVSAFAFTSADAQVLECFIELPDGTVIEVPVGAPADDFGGLLTTGQSVSGMAVKTVADFSADDPADDDETMGCGPITNTDVVAGNIALVNRGGCFFSDKVYYAGEAGASAAIICNHTPGAGTIGMASGGDFGGQATIPSGFLSYEDCETIYTVIDAGETVNITLSVPNLYNAYGPYANQTPQKQIRTLDEVSLTFANVSEEVLPGVTMTAVITNPAGEETTLEAGPHDVAALEDSIFRFDDYLPEAIGDYVIEFTNNQNSSVVTREFKITEDTYAVDNDEINNWVSVSAEDFATDGLRIDLATFFLAGPTDESQVISQVSFALENPDSLYVEGNDAANTFSIIIYDMDQDLDGEVDGTSYDNYATIAFGTYVLQGTEEAHEVLTTDITSLTGEALLLNPEGQYMAAVQYDGTTANLGIPPHFSTGGASDYPYYGSFVFTDQLYLGGWSSGTNARIRVHVADYTSATNLELLDEGQISVSPNPASTFININFDLERMAETVTYNVTNLSGQIVKRAALENVQTGAYQVDVQDLTTGIYFLNAVTPEGVRSIKFIVE